MKVRWNQGSDKDREKTKIIDKKVLTIDTIHIILMRQSGKKQKNPENALGS